MSFAPRVNATNKAAFQARFGTLPLFVTPTQPPAGAPPSLQGSLFPVGHSTVSPARRRASSTVTVSPACCLLADAMNRLVCYPTAAVQALFSRNRTHNECERRFTDLFSADGANAVRRHAIETAVATGNLTVTPFINRLAYVVAPVYAQAPQGTRHAPRSTRTRRQNKCLCPSPALLALRVPLPAAVAPAALQIPRLARSVYDFSFY